MLVLLAGLGQPGLVVVAVKVLHKLHLAINRIPVGMHIERTHKDGDHEALIVEISVLFYLFYYNNLTIGGRDNQLVGIAIEIADGATIKVECDKPRGAEHHHEYPKWYACVKTVP